MKAVREFFTTLSGGLGVRDAVMYPHGQYLRLLSRVNVPAAASDLTRRTPANKLRLIDRMSCRMPGGFGIGWPACLRS